MTALIFALAAKLATAVDFKPPRIFRVHNRLKVGDPGYSGDGGRDDSTDHPRLVYPQSSSSSFSGEGGRKLSLGLHVRLPGVSQARYVHESAPHLHNRTPLPWAPNTPAAEPDGHYLPRAPGQSYGNALDPSVVF